MQRLSAWIYCASLLKTPLTLRTSSRACSAILGTTPGLNFIYVHLNRVFKKYDLGIFTFSVPNTAVARCGEIVVALPE